MNITKQLITLASLLVATSLPATEQNNFTDAEGDSIKAFLHEHFNNDHVAAVIGLVDEHGSRIFSSGTLDNGTTNEVSGDSVFFIGSITKTFTTLLLQDMVERGEMRLDDPVAKYLPKSVKVPTHGGKEITLLDLATQTAGFPINPDNMTGKDSQEQYETYTIEKMYAFLAKFELSRDPGTEFEYSNVGMALLGHAISLKAQTNFESLVINRICRPLHMDNTHIVLSPELRPRLAMAHDNTNEPSPPWNLQAYDPAGGIRSTPNDLLKYAAANAGLSAPSRLTPLMEKTHVIRHKDSHGLPGVTDKTFFGNTAMCWVDAGSYQPPGMQLLGHAGGAGGYHVWVGFDKKQHRGVVVFSTANIFYVGPIGWTVLQRLPLNIENANATVIERVGLGFALGTNQTQDIHITKVYSESSAALAGLSSGDIIQKIGGVAVHGKSLTECLDLLRADVGGKVTLEVSNAEQTNTFELKKQKFITLTQATPARKTARGVPTP